MSAPLGISPNQDDVTTALRSFLLDILPAGTEVILGQINRVPEPLTGQFVVMTPTRFRRIDTNFDFSLDLKMTGSIAGTTMTVTAVDPKSPGAVVVGSSVFGVGVKPGTQVTGLISGAGGTGTYQVAPSQTLAPGTLSAGRKAMVQAAQVTVQLDFHDDGDGSAGADMAQTASTLLRDEYGVGAMEPSGVVPLFADDPNQLPFVNDQQQYEWRWVLEAQFQVNQKTTVPQEYADQVNVGLVEVDGRYPP